MLRWCLMVHPPTPSSLTFEFTLLSPLTREGSQLHTARLQQQVYCPAPGCVEILLHGCLTTNPEPRWHELFHLAIPFDSFPFPNNQPASDFHPQGSVLLIWPQWPQPIHQHLPISWGSTQREFPMLSFHLLKCLVFFFQFLLDYCSPRCGWPAAFPLFSCAMFDAFPHFSPVSSA